MSRINYFLLIIWWTLDVFGGYADNLVDQRGLNKCKKESIGVRDESNRINDIDLRLRGRWRPIYSMSSGLSVNTNLCWRSINFSTNQMVEMRYENMKVRKKVFLHGKYKVRKDVSDNSYKFTIDIYDEDNGDRIFTLFKVRIGEFSCFPREVPVMWFNDSDGHDYTFTRDNVSDEDKNLLLGRGLSISMSVESESSDDSKKRELTGADLEVKLEGKWCKNIYEKHKILLEVMNSGDMTCTPYVLKFLDKKEDFILRIDAIRALGAMGNPKVAPPLLALLETPIVKPLSEEDGEEAILRRTLVSALANIGGENVYGVLRKIEESDQEYKSVRELARQNLSKRK